MKAQAIVTSQGRIVSLDIAVNYCHDMKLFKMSRRNIGQAGKILADSGYQGLMKIYPQAQTPRKSSKLKPLTAEDKASLKDDLDADSVDLMEFILTLEDEFSIEISDEEIDQLQSVGDVVKIIQGK
ncbi:mobile genetic element [Streptococcus pneumoniae]|nr:mobile genetic element [Streptococcus pneumoniae]